MNTTDALPWTLSAHERVVFFTGAGISAESGVPTYRGRAGIWETYDPDTVASQTAFEHDPDGVLAFHEARRAQVAQCAAHRHIAALQARHGSVAVITQNVDGLHEQAGSTDVVTLHGSLWRTRCARHGTLDDRSDGPYQRRHCPECDAPLRPDITWFGDAVNQRAFKDAEQLVARADTFVAIGTSAVVRPAAGFIELAARGGARMVEINPETGEASGAFAVQMRMPATEALPALLPLPMNWQARHLPRG